MPPPISTKVTRPLKSIPFLAGWSLSPWAISLCTVGAGVMSPPVTRIALKGLAPFKQPIGLRVRRDRQAAAGAHA